MTFYTERETRTIYDVRPIGDFILIRPAAPGFERALEKLHIGTFVDRFEEFLGDPHEV